MPAPLPADDSVPVPELRLVRLDHLVEHEFNDVHRTVPLAERLRAEGQLKNPPIVAALDDDDDRYVVLDGANRTMALTRLGYEHVLVQVVRYEPPSVTLTTWHHLICGLAPQAFIAALTVVPGVDLLRIDRLHARAGLARRELLLYIVGADDQIYAARPQLPGLSVHEQNRLLNALVDTYRTSGQLHRLLTDNLKEAGRLFPDVSGLVIFPNYDSAEVLALARDGELLPTGLTRHLIQGRALRTNYPLAELACADSLELKNARLQSWLSQKLSSKEVRFYGETTFSFDE